MKTEIDPMMESEYMSWNKKQLIQQIKNRDRANERLNEDLKQLHKEFTEQAIKIDEKNVRINELVTKLDICRASLQLSTQEHHIRNGEIDALKELLKSIRPYVGQIQIPHGSMFLKEIKQLLKSDVK